MPIDETASSDEEPKGLNAPPDARVAANAVAIPSDEQIADLGSHGREAYGKITGKILSQSKAADLGDMSAKLTELVSLSKGFKPDAAKHGLLERAIGLGDQRAVDGLRHERRIPRPAAAPASARAAPGAHRRAPSWRTTRAVRRLDRGPI